MGRMANRETLLERFMSLSHERAGRAFKIATIITSWCIVSCLFIFILSLALVFKGASGFENSLRMAASFLFDFIPGQDPVPSEYFAWAVGARCFGFILTCVFSGMIVAAFLKPLDFIRLSRYALVETDKERLAIRYKVSLPPNQYLLNVSARVRVSDRRERNTGDPGDVAGFEFVLPNDLNRFPSGTYKAMRGVWYIYIPLSASSADGSRVMLENALTEYFRPQPESRENERHESPRIDVLITGESEGGELICRRLLYSSENLLVGYRFVSVQRREIVQQSKETESQKKDKRQYFPRHFNKVCKIAATDDEQIARTRELAQAIDHAEPDKDDVLLESEWVEYYFVGMCKRAKEHVAHWLKCRKRRSHVKGRAK